MFISYSHPIDGHKVGDVVDVAPAVARSLIHDGLAVEAKAPKAPKSPRSPEPTPEPGDTQKEAAS